MPCASTLLETDAPQNPQSEIANEGQAFHVALSHVPRGIEPDAEEIAGQFGVDPDDIRRVVAYGRQAWDEIKQWVRGTIKTEEPLSGPVCGGTTDVIAIEQSEMLKGVLSIVVIDWKTGWSQNEHPWQLTGYADCARAQFGMPVSGHILAFEIWVRSKQYRSHKLTEGMLDAFRTRLSSQFEQVGKQYGAGTHCQYCPRINQCQVRADYVRGTMAALTTVGETGLTREDIGRLYEKSKVLDKALRTYGKLLDEELALGPIDLGDGRKLTLVETEREKISARNAWPVLMGAIDAEDLDNVLSVSKTKLYDCVKARAKKRQGAAQQRKIMAELRDAKAVFKTTYQKKAVI